MSNEVVIKVENVSKYFKLPHDKATSIKSSLINFARRKTGYDLQHALEDINFEVHKGEFYGIVGKNGGGKSTLLKIISGIYLPTKGIVHVNGKLTPFIELGVGFNPELTGRENVYLNGALLGFNRKEMKAMYDDIVAFAELSRFMDQKLKNYSSGMQVRLAFSIAIRAQSDILIMDEVLAVGDAAFQKKCFNVFRELKNQGRTIVLVTHDMGNVERFCDKVLVLDKGKQLTVTNPAEASSIYARLNIDNNQLTQKEIDEHHTKVRSGSGEIKLAGSKFLNGYEETNIFNIGDPFIFSLQLKCQKGYENIPIVCGLAFYNEDGVVVAGPNSLNAKLKSSAKNINITIPKLPFAAGEYKMTIAICDKDGMNPYDLLEKWVSFSVISDHIISGLVSMECEWVAK